MGVNTIGFVPLKNPGVFEVAAIAREALIKHLRAKLPIDTGHWEAFAQSSVEVECEPDQEMVILNFKDGVDQRNIYIHFDCHCNYRDVYDGDKLIFSLRLWGDSVTLIQVVGRALAEKTKRDFYWIENDCGDDWKIERRPRNAHAKKVAV